MIETIQVPFTQEDCVLANREWNCNCGPAALAASLGVTLEQIRPPCESAGFAQCGYMTPTIMRNAIRHAGGSVIENKIKGILIEALKLPRHGIARIQWEGPWTEEGANPRWGYRHTHWIASWLPKANSSLDAIDAALDPIVFDINGGLMSFEEWEEDIVEQIVCSIPRADGGWHVTHSWELRK